MAARSTFRRAVFAGFAAALGGLGAAQAQTATVEPWSFAASRSAVGLQPATLQYSVGCGASLLPCRNPEAAALALAEPRSLRWNLELAVLKLGNTSLAGGAPASRQGLNLSLVGRKPLFGSSFSVYGKLGTTYGLHDGTANPGFGALEAGPSFGAGLAYEVTPRLSATLGWDSHELRLGGGGRDAFRATSLGLQYRY
jgi:hypothetical protein